MTDKERLDQLIKQLAARRAQLRELKRIAAPSWLIKTQEDMVAEIELKIITDFSLTDRSPEVKENLANQEKLEICWITARELVHEAFSQFADELIYLVGAEMEAAGIKPDELDPEAYKVGKIGRLNELFDKAERGMIVTITKLLYALAEQGKGEEVN